MTKRKSRALTPEEQRAIFRALSGRGAYRVPTAAKMKPKRKARTP